MGVAWCARSWARGAVWRAHVPWTCRCPTVAGIPRRFTQGGASRPGPEGPCTRAEASSRSVAGFCQRRSRRTGQRGSGRAKTVAGLPPARAGLPTPDDESGRVPRCWGEASPHTPLGVAALRGRTSGLSWCPVCCRFASLGQPALLTSPSIHGEAFCSPARPCCSSSWEGTQDNRPCAPASRPEAHAPLPIASNGSPP
jgi:hypothetical protein